MREGCTKGTYMAYTQNKDSPFQKKIRIKPEQLEWIRTHKGRYTLAGKLDEIINFYKANAPNQTDRGSGGHGTPRQE
jgi:hypothetical protein